VKEPSVIEQAFQALDMRRPEDAAAILKDHLWRDPSDGVAYAALGVALSQMGDIPSALDAMEQAHYLRPQDPRVLYNYGLVLEAAGRPREARTRFSAAVRLDPRYERAWRRLSVLEAGEARREEPALAASYEADGPEQLAPLAVAPVAPPPQARVTEVSEPETLEAEYTAVEGVHPPPVNGAAGANGHVSPGDTPGWVGRPLGDRLSEKSRAAEEAAIERRALLSTVGWVGGAFAIGGLAWAIATWPRPLEIIGPYLPQPAQGTSVSIASSGGRPGAKVAAGQDLSNQDLSGRDFTGADITRTIFTGAQLRKTNLARTTAIGARFEKADMQQAYLRGANLEAAILTGARLNGAYLQRANLSLSDLTGARLNGANLTEARLDGANLSNVDLRAANLRDCRLDGAVLTGARFDQLTRWPEGFSPRNTGAIFSQQ
jgi:tetratricopeptide (TPR) repeat protein